MNHASVTVWRIDIPAFEPHLPALTALLNDAERARAARYGHRQDQVRAIVARASLRLLLARETGLAPEALVFTHGANGKPMLAPPLSGMHFNVSHSEDVVLIAVSTDCAMLGIDVEQMLPLPDADAMAAHLLTARERAVYETLTAAARAQALYQAWTCKEALAKACGDGVEGGFDRFEVMLVPNGSPRVLAIDGSTVEAADWCLVKLDVGLGYAAVVAGGAGILSVCMADMEVCYLSTGSLSSGQRG
jgi:4'-phosphopantetheinyl transferase